MEKQNTKLTITEELLNGVMNRLVRKVVVVNFAITAWHTGLRPCRIPVQVDVTS